jgi:hypothetical protein
MKATAATTPPFVPIPPPPASPSARGELSLDAPRAASDEPEVKVIDRPWWVSPPAIVLGLLLCGPFGAFVVAAMWVRGGYTKRAKITAAVVWAGLMILQGAAVAISFQAMVAGMLADTGRLTGLPLAGATATPLVFSTPAAGAVSNPQAVVPKPAGAVASPAAGASGPAGAAPPPPGGPPGAGPVPQTSPIAAAPSQGTVVPPPGAQGQPTGERLRVIDTGGSGANVRERPGSTAPIAKTVPDGAILVVVGADQQVDGRGWRNVRDSEGISGWVAAELVEPAR